MHVPLNVKFNYGGTRRFSSRGGPATGYLLHWSSRFFNHCTCTVLGCQTHEENTKHLSRQLGHHSCPVRMALPADWSKMQLKDAWFYYSVSVRTEVLCLDSKRTYCENFGRSRQILKYKKSIYLSPPWKFANGGCVGGGAALESLLRLRTWPI